jgi:hypothetical protein
MNIINGKCRTNLDEYQNHEWPTQFVAVPRIGERVESIDGLKSLKVVGITHCVKDNFSDNPYIKIELHK